VADHHHALRPLRRHWICSNQRLEKNVATKQQGREWQMRTRLAQEAARIMIEDGITDFAGAKRKAAEHLGVSHTRNLPRNQEIEEARRDYQELFLGEQIDQQQQRLQAAALQAMEFLAEFEPRLIGQVLEGCATPHAAVELHLFADTPETIGLFLHRHNIPHDQQQARIRYDRDTVQEMPVYTFMAGDVAIELTVFPPAGRRRLPLSPVDGQPMHRADLAEVEALGTEPYQ
jgi:hypothetical protein